MKITKQNIKTICQQSIKIIAEIVVKMDIVARINLSSKLKNHASEIGYYSYTNRWQTLNNDYGKQRTTLKKHPIKN